MKNQDIKEENSNIEENQRCGAENISLGSGSNSGSAEPQIRIVAPAPTPALAPNKFYKIP
jgi:hypothetical protein